MKTVSVAIADAAPMFRAAVRAALQGEGFRVLEAKDLKELLGIASRRRDAIVLLDVDLPPLGGLVAASALSERFGIHPILWSSDLEGQDVLAAIRAGAAGYLSKQISPAGLVNALRKFRKGEAPLSRGLTLRMIEGIHALEAWQRVEAKLAVLSRRESEVLRLIAAGLTNKQIAEKLVLSPATVKRHVQNLLGKLELPSRRAAAALYAPFFASVDAVPPSGRPARERRAASAE
jgi:DNA-binding NarL/FixJ family response regulator